jgi:O-antigen/teichoic acid export membrane protein
MSSDAPPGAAAPGGGGTDRGRGGVSGDLRRAFINMAAKAGSIVIERVAQLVLMLGAAPILGVVSFGRFSFANGVTALLAFGTDLGLTLWTTRALAREPALRVDEARLAELGPSPSGTSARTPHPAHPAETAASSREGPGTLPGFPEQQSSVLGTAYHLRLWATVPYFIALSGVALSLGPGEARIAMLAIGVVSLARALLDHARAVFRARERIADEGKVNAIGASLATIGGLAAVALTRQGLPALALGMMAGTLVSVVYGFALLGRRYGPWTGPFDRGLARRMLREALPFWLAGIFSLAYSRGDVIMLRALTGDADVGAYRAAGQLYDVAKTLPVVVMTAMFPQLARHFRFARARLRRAEWGVSASLAAGGILTAAVLAIAAGFVARRIFGAGFVRTVPALHILSAALPLVFLNCGLTHFLVARDLGVLNMVFAGLMVPVNVVANWVLSRRLGAPGAAWSMLITEAGLTICCLLALYIARRQDFEVPRIEPVTPSSSS